MQQKILNKFVNWAQKQPKIIAVYLFGSVATGVDNALSDLDIAVLLQTGLTKAQMWQLEHNWAADWPEKLDLHIINLAPLAFQYEVTALGQRLWASDVCTVADMESLIWRKYWDFRPRLDQAWKDYTKHLLENRDATEREQYQAALAQVRSVHKRIRATAADSTSRISD
jgi:predicted nucleotidyltransferase